MSSQLSKQFKKIMLAVVFGVLGVFLFQIKVDWPQRSSAQPNAQSVRHWTERSASDKPVGADVSTLIASLNKAFINLAENASPAVVNIYTKSKVPVRRRGAPGMDQDDLFRFFFGNPFGEPFGMPQERVAQSLGSGFLINTQGVIITNSHVVRPTGRNADSVMVKFIFDSEKSEGHPATIVGVDESTDVAVIRLKKPLKDLKVAPLGNSDQVKVGEWVIAIGNPYGHSHSVTKGIVSALGRNIAGGLPSTGGIQRSDFIQTDASINPGNSGGPLLNLYGEVVGINTAIDARAQGIGFAIPINVAKSVVSQILEKGQVTLGWIGVALAELTPQIAKSLGLGSADGAFIQEVVPQSPADRAGMMAYDVVKEINGKKIISERELLQTVAGSAPGTRLQVKVFREGKERSLEVVVAKRPSDKDLAKNLGRDFEDNSPSTLDKAVGKTGLSLMELSGELRRRLGLDTGTKGALVHNVDPDGPAALIGIQPGDLIVEVDRKPVRNVAEARKALTAKKDSFLVRIQRGSASVIVLLDVSGS